jgi:hypothetical protein
VAQQVLEAAEPPDDLVVDLAAGDPPVPRPGRMPLGRRGQLRALRRQLVWCDHAVRVAQREADRAMRDPDLDDEARWAAVRRLRTLAWKVCREVLPLVGRVPPGLQAEGGGGECHRGKHVLLPTTEAALQVNASYTVDLVAAERDPIVPR